MNTRKQINGKLFSFVLDSESKNNLEGFARESQQSISSIIRKSIKNYTGKK